MPLTLNLQSFLRSDASWVFSRIPSTAGGGQANASVSPEALSADGRYLFFSSYASNLVVGDTNNTGDLFRKDLLTGAVIRVSTAKSGAEANGDSSGATLSSDGKYLFFTSAASNLVAGDTNSANDIFRKDLTTGEVTRISIAQDGTQADGVSFAPKLSADGRYVFFASFASNLVADDTNGTLDLFRKDLVSGDIIRVSTTKDGTQADNGGGQTTVISADGQFAIFTSASTNLVEGRIVGTQIFRKNIVTGEVILLSNPKGGAQADGSSISPVLSVDGRYLFFTSEASNLVPGDTNEKEDIFRKDLVSNEIIRVSTARDGTQANGKSDISTVSPDGRYVFFTSEASNLVPGDTNAKKDLFRKDLVTGDIIRIFAPATASGTENEVGPALLSADGQHLFFRSSASLLPGDTNQTADIFRIAISHLADSQAFIEGRVARLQFGVGNASSVSLSWGDGTTDTVTPANGTVSFQHIYGTTGVKSVTVTVREGTQTWVVPYVIDLSAGTASRNTTGADQLFGGASSDRLVGDASSNVINGGSGNDKIWGDYGNDTLTGGSGKDVFVFNTKPGTYKTDRVVNFDRITDFKVKDDSIWLDNKYFKKLGKKGSEKKPVKLDKEFFIIGTKAKEKDDYLVYNKKTGVLSYDADGSGKGKAVEIAQLSKNLKLTEKDFFVI